MPSLDLIDPNNEFQSAASYQFPTSTPPKTNWAEGEMYGAMGVSALSALISGFSQSSAARAQGDIQASVARTNAAIARLQAKQTIEAGSAEASKINQRTAQTVGSLRAAQGASGIAVNSGSNALITNAVTGMGMQDELTIRNNAARRAWGFETQAIQDTYKGQFEQLTGNAAARQSLLTGGLKAISTPLAIESNYLRWSRSQGGITSTPFPDAGMN